MKEFASKSYSNGAFDIDRLGCWLGESADDVMARRVFGAICNGVTISDARLPGAPLIYLNPAFERMTGYSELDVVGLSCNFLQGNDRDQPGVHRIRAAIREAQEERALLRNYRKDGTLLGRGRDGHYWPPPAQIRTSGVAAYGSCLRS